MRLMGCIADALDDLAQVGFRIPTVELGGADQAVDGGGAFTAGIGAGEQIVLAPDISIGGDKYSFPRAAVDELAGDEVMPADIDEETPGPCAPCRDIPRTIGHLLATVVKFCRSVETRIID